MRRTCAHWRIGDCTDLQLLPGRENGAKEDLMISVKEDGLLVRDESFVKYRRLLRRAENEGRIDGPNKCLVCGMRYLSKDEAEACCNIAP